jgi:hypothetical protein
MDQNRRAVSDPSLQEAREAADGYGNGKEEEMPDFHEVRALSLHLYQKTGKAGQKIAGRASQDMTRTIRRTTRRESGPRRFQTSISVNRGIVLRQFCAYFAQNLNEKRDQRRK